MLRGGHSGVGEAEGKSLINAVSPKGAQKADGRALGQRWRVWL